MTKRRAQQTALFAEEHGQRKPVSPQARAMCSRGKKQAPAPKPWEAVLLVVDTAKVSGWAIGARGQLLDHGQHDTEKHPEETARVMGLAYTWSIAKMLPLVMVLEAPYGGFKTPGMVKVLVALGAAKERWLACWRAASLPKSKVVTVEPKSWRGPVLGSWAAGLRREQVRASEMSIARGIVGREDLGEDEATAICIHSWAAHAAKVGEALGKRGQRASLRAWETRR